MGWRVGVDSGGTFTDICLLEEETGRMEIWKVPSTPSNPADGILTGVIEGARVVETDPARISYLGHGTTVATNALIQRTGADVALITTEGFRDLLEIGRQRRPHLYDLQADKAPVLAPRKWRFGIAERVLHDGTVEKAVDEKELRSIVRQLREAGAGAVAVCFLYSFLRPDHEETVARIIEEEMPGAFVSISSRIAPEFREFERMSTAVVNSHLGPVMNDYVRQLVGRLAEVNVGALPHITQSNGGVISPEEAAEFPVRAVLSGPSTGVVAAQAIAESTGMRNLITFDMGGTSSDVALLTDGEARIVNEAVVHGYPLKTPMFDIHTVGAGGGSIAFIDSGGLLNVGPRSAGAYPGPAAYGNGNTEPTVTDANVVLKTLNPEFLLDGRMRIDSKLACDAVQTIADALSLNLMQAAEGILEVVSANMAKAIRVISVQKGYDPRDYTLLAFGGAGPIHAARLAAQLDIKRILIPPTPGILCALGLLMTDLRKDFAVTNLRLLDNEAIPVLAGLYGDLDAMAAEWLDREGIAEARRTRKRTIDVRYLGQNYEIAVPVPDGPVDQATVDAIRQGFLDRHRRLYGFVVDGEPIQMVTCRLEAFGVVDKVKLLSHPEGKADASAARVGERSIWSAERNDFIPAQIYDRRKLAPNNVIEGPAIIDQMDTTTVVPANMSARVDAFLNLIMEAK